MGATLDGQMAELRLCRRKGCSLDREQGLGNKIHFAFVQPFQCFQVYHLILYSAILLAVHRVTESCHLFTKQMVKIRDGV